MDTGELVSDDLMIALDPRPRAAGRRPRRIHPGRFPAHAGAGPGAARRCSAETGDALSAGGELRGGRARFWSERMAGRAAAEGRVRRPARDDPRAAARLPGEDRAAGRTSTASGTCSRTSTASAPWPRSRGRIDEALLSGASGRFGELGMITIRSHEELRKLEEASRIVLETLDVVEKAVAPGRDDRRARPDRGGGDPPPGRAAGLRGLPGIPEDPVHLDQRRGRPRDPGEAGPERTGDIIGIDCGASWTATSATRRGRFRSGAIDVETARLLEVTRRALLEGIAAARPGGAGLGHRRGRARRSPCVNGYGVVRDFVGHGVGTALHEEPQIPNYGPAGRGSC